jgi:putative membrane protein
MSIIIRLILNSIAVYLSAILLPGIKIASFWRAVLVAIILAVVNYTVKPLLILLTLPVTILTLGLFLFVINALMILLVSYIVKGFEVSNFWWALLFSLVLSIISSILDKIFK